MLLTSVLERMKKVSLDGKLGLDSEVEEGETVIGVLENEDIKKLYILMLETSKKLVDLLKNSRDLPTSKEECKKTLKEIQLLKNEKELLSVCFWNSVRQEMPETLDLDYDSIGIRKDWQVVGFSDETPIIITTAMPFPFI